MELPKTLTKWKVERLQNIKKFKFIGNEQTAVLLIVLGCHELVSIKIQQIELSLTRELHEKYIKRTERSGSQGFIDIIIGNGETFGLLENGQIVSFKSFKKFEIDDRFYGLSFKYFTLLSNEKFASVRVLKNEVILEIYDRYPVNTNVKYKFDLTWPDNGELETSRLNERYFLQLFNIEDPNHFQFFKSLLIELPEDLTEVLLLSIDEKLYWLIPLDDDDFSIEAIKVCSSAILEFHFLPKLSSMLVLEDSNSLSIIYSCPYTNLVRQKTILLEGTVVSYEFIVSQQLFVYSNLLKVFQIQISIDELSNQIQHVVREVKLAGIKALSYINYLKIFIGISENELFYKIPIVKHQVPVNSSEELPDFIEITNQAESINDLAKRVFDEQQNQRVAETQLKDRMIDFRTLTSLQNKDFKLDFKATVTYHKSMPNLKEFAVVPKQSCCWSDSNVFVEILFELREDLIDILKTWKICVGSGTYMLMSNIKGCKELQIIFFEKLNDQLPTLPNIDLYLNTVFNMGNSFFLVQKKIEFGLENLEQLANFSAAIHKNFFSRQSNMEAIEKLCAARKFNSNVTVESTIMVPRSKLKILLDELGFTDIFYLNFFKSFVEVKITENTIHIQSDNAAALLFAKKYFFFKMGPLSIKPLISERKQELKAIENSKNCEVDKKYLMLRKLVTYFAKKVK